MTKLFRFLPFLAGAILFAFVMRAGFEALPLKNFLADTSAIGSTTYYVDAAGNDTNSGISADQAWKTVAKVNAAALQPGDSVLFKRGGSYLGPLVVSRSGAASAPITFGAYGDGPKPALSGFVRLSGWKDDGGGIWEASCTACGSTVNMVRINGAVQPIGRYPNADAANGGYLTVASHSSNVSISDPLISSMPDWTGADIVIRKNHWILDRNKITGQSGNTISYTSASQYSATDGYGYFIENTLKALDESGEWYYDPVAKKLYVYGDFSSATVEAATLDTVASVAGQSYVVFDNLRIEGSNQKSLSISNANNVTVQNSEVFYSGTNGIDAANSSGLVIQQDTVSHANNNAFTCPTCSNTLISSNTFSDNAMVAGMGKSGDGNGFAISISTTNNTLANVAIGSNNTITGNTVTDTGYIGINFNGNGTVVENNVINRFASVKDDGAGIYMWTNPNFPEFSGRAIRNNIVTNGIGASVGANDSGRGALDANGYLTGFGTANGIYLDDNTSNVDVVNNTAANNNGQGIFVHNGHALNIVGNTLVNNTFGQIAMAHSSNYPNSPIRNVTVKNNILLSLDPAQLPLKLTSIKNDIAQFGTMNGNTYFIPSSSSGNDIAFIQNYNDAQKLVNSYYDISQWQSVIGIDTSSALASFGAGDAPRFEYNSSQSSLPLSLDGAYKDAKGNISSGSLTLPAFSSVVLRKTAPIAVDTTEPVGSSDNSAPSGDIASDGKSDTAVPVVDIPAPTIVSIPESITTSISNSISNLVTSIPTGTWSFIPIIKNIVSPSKPVVDVTPSAPVPSSSDPKKTYDIVQADYLLNGSLIHSSVPYPDGWKLNTSTLLDGTYTLSSRFYYTDGSVDGSTSTFTVDNSPTILEQVVSYVRGLLKR